MGLKLKNQEQRRQNTLLLTLATCIVASLVFSEFLTRAHLGIASFWPANGLLAVGLMALKPPQRITLTVVAIVFHLLIGLLVGDPIGRAVIFTSVDTLEAYAVWGVTRRLTGGMPRVRTMHQLALLFAADAPIVVIVALVGAAALSLGSHAPYLDLAWAWFARSGLGLAVVAPAALVLLDAEHRRSFRRSRSERLALFVAIAAVTALCFHPRGFPAPFLIMPLTMLAVFRLGARGAAETSLIVACVAIPLMVPNSEAQTGVRWGASDTSRVAQVFVALLFVTNLATGLALAQQERLKRLLVRREQLTRVARVRALAATEAKTEFLATMSHEIRTPLNSILGFAQLLSLRDDLPPDARHQVNMIDSAGGALLTVANDILDLSRAGAGHIELSPQPTFAPALLRETASILAPEARAKGLALDVEIVDPVATLHELDDARLRQVLLHLLNNAVKFTERGQINVRLIVEPGDAEDRLRFEVIDTGIGVPVDKQPLLFQRFSQADSLAGRPPGGAGLGLAISRALVELMGGKIGFDSVPGRGSCFWIEIVAPVAEPLATPERPKPATTGAGRILLVDDHPMNREIGVALLTVGGWQVDTAENGQQAVEAAETGQYDMILMDIHMPVMDGLAATRAIRALGSKAGQVPIIAMSADALPQQIERCYAAGMVDHIAKPIQRDALYAKVERWMAAPALDA